MTTRRPNAISPTQAARRLLSLTVLSDRLIADQRRLSMQQRENLQRLTRHLYRSLPDPSRVAFQRHLRERYLSQGAFHRRQHR